MLLSAQFNHLHALVAIRYAHSQHPSTMVQLPLVFFCAGFFITVAIAAVRAALKSRVVRVLGDEDRLFVTWRGDCEEALIRASQAAVSRLIPHDEVSVDRTKFPMTHVFPTDY